MRIQSLLIAAGLTAVFAAAGCGSRNPVQEVSISDSGIAIRDLPSSATLPTDWPSWRGKTNDGIVPQQAMEKSLPSRWSEQTNIRWRTEVPGRGHCSPIVVGDSVYLATAVDQRQQQLVMSFDRKTGTPSWTTVVHEGGFPPPEQVHKKGSNANGTIATDGQQLYIGFLNGDAIMATALDLQGNIAWQKEIGKFISRFGYAPSPILYKSLIIFAADNRGGGYIAALDAESGNVAWRISRGSIDSYSTPVVANVGGRDQLLISGCDAVTSYDPGTGTQNWSTECVAESTCGTIVTSANRIFASGGYPDKETVCLSAEGKLLWSNSTKIYEPSMLVVGDRLVGVNDDGIAYCWSIDNGDQLWRTRLGGNFSASPILYGQNIYVANLKGETFVFRAGDKYEQVARNQLGDDCYASPAISDGEIFLRIGVGSDRQRREQLVCIAAESDSLAAR